MINSYKSCGADLYKSTVTFFPKYYASWRAAGTISRLAPFIIIIDEIQKLPELLDEVHYLIEEKKIKFLLTGSSSSKFYFFDWGITRKLQGIKNISPKTELFGKAFESLIFQELKAYCSYNKIKNLNFWRTYQKDEVDFILDNRVAIEVKSNNVFKKKYVKSLANLYKEKILEKYYIVYTGPDLFLDEYKWLKIKNYKSFIKELYSGKILR